MVETSEITFEARISKYGTNRKHIEIPKQLRHIESGSRVVCIVIPEPSLSNKLKEMIKKIKK